MNYIHAYRLSGVQFDGAAYSELFDDADPAMVAFDEFIELGRFATMEVVNLTEDRCIAVYKFRLDYHIPQH
jgi:hypothetical protein